MTGTTHSRHPSVAPMELTLLHCGCRTVAPGHTSHLIQARVFTSCRAEDIHDARIHDIGHNEFTVAYSGRQRRAWRSPHAAVAQFCAVATQENAVVAKLDRGNMLTAFDEGGSRGPFPGMG